MKSIIKLLSVAVLLGMIASCSLDLDNPNAASEEQILKTKDGMFTLAVGIKTLYATSAHGSAVNTVAISQREASAMTTFSSLEELEIGGAELSTENERVDRFFSRVYRVKGMAEDLLNNLDEVALEDGTKAGLFAYATLFHSMCVGTLAQNWEMVALENSRDNEATYSDRMTALNTAVANLEDALGQLNSNELSAEFNSKLGEIDLENTLNAMLARYNNMAGNNQAAITAANAVDQTSVSWFDYDSENRNPVYSGYFLDPIEFAPRDNFGLPTELAVDPADGRIAFHMGVRDELSLSQLPVEFMVSPFFSTEDADIPLYIPSEMDLIKAEAYARSGDQAAAEAALNAVRNRLPADDPMGLSYAAGLADTYTANGDADALLEEIYINRRIELFLFGMSMEDSRRFHRPSAPTQVDYTSEKNRNFYPYPNSERSANPNTPADPAI